MKLRLLIALFLGIFLILPIVSALDQEVIQIFGGDSELLIGCLGDEELIFFGGEIPSVPPGGGGKVTPPGEIYTHISFDIFGTSIGDYPITNIQIINATPIEFKEALPLTIQSLAVGDTNKLLWTSDLIEVGPLIDYSQPLTFWLNLSGVVSEYIFYEQGSIDLTIEPTGEESEATPGFAIFFPDFSFLEEWGFTGEDISLFKWVLVIITLILVIFLTKRRMKKKATKKEKKEGRISMKSLKKKERRGNLIDILLIIGIILLFLSISFIPVKEEKIETKIVVHYYMDGVEITLPTAEASSSTDLFYPTQVSPKKILDG